MLDPKLALTSSHPHFHNLAKIKEKEIQSTYVEFSILTRNVGVEQSIGMVAGGAHSKQRVTLVTA